jgi:hypothetical protein
MFNKDSIAGKVNLDRHSVSTGNTLEVYQGSKLICKATWVQENVNAKRHIDILYCTPELAENPALIVKATKVVERGKRGQIVDNFRSLKSNLGKRDGIMGRPLSTVKAAIG